MITSLKINGLRGFSKETQIEFAEPNGKWGSGLTFFVDPNNSGKTTILEGLKAFNSSKDTPPSFSERFISLTRIRDVDAKIMVKR